MNRTLIPRASIACSNCWAMEAFGHVIGSWTLNDESNVFIVVFPPRLLLPAASIQFPNCLVISHYMVKCMRLELISRDLQSRLIAWLHNIWSRYEESHSSFTAPNRAWYYSTISWYLAQRLRVERSWQVLEARLIPDLSAYKLLKKNTYC